MIFEDDPKPIVQEAILHQNISMVSHTINFGADKSYVLNSLRRMKSSTLCEIRKKLIDNFIIEYLSSFSGVIENQGFESLSESYNISSVYAKQSYEKVLKEQEYLSRVMMGLKIE
jgi:hypothetical protein